MKNIKEKKQALRDLPVRLAQAMRVARHKQKDVENITKISQSQICRVLKGEFKREGKAVRELSKYANNYSSNECKEDQPMVRQQLSEEILSVWDGSSADGRRLLRLLGIVKEFRSLQ